MPHLIAVDWGTSSLRGARLDQAGRVLEEKTAPLGVLNVPNGDFAGVFAAQFSQWMTPGTRCLISGMAGSRQGWAEAPYVACPAGPGELARHLHWIERDRIAIVPGLSDTQADVPDVMRGEEVQIFGAMRLSGVASPEPPAAKVCCIMSLACGHSACLAVYRLPNRQAISRDC